MTTLEQIKRKGAEKAIKEAIESLKFDLTDRNWEGIICSTNYIRLEEAINDAKKILSQMEELLCALRELDPANR